MTDPIDIWSSELVVFLVRVLNEPSLKADDIQLMEELFRRMDLDPARYTIQICGKRREYAADILFDNPELEASFLMAALNYSEADAEDAERAAKSRVDTMDYPALEGDICPPSLFESEEEEPELDTPQMMGDICPPDLDDDFKI